MSMCTDVGYIYANTPIYTDVGLEPMFECCSCVERRKEETRTTAIRHKIRIAGAEQQSSARVHVLCPKVSPLEAVDRAEVAFFTVSKPKVGQEFFGPCFDMINSARTMERKWKKCKECKNTKEHAYTWRPSLHDTMDTMARVCWCFQTPTND